MTEIDVKMQRMLRNFLVIILDNFIYRTRKLGLFY
jgi:hypothetical protein